MIILLPTLRDVLSVDEPAQCDGRSLTPLLGGEDVRGAAPLTTNGTTGRTSSATSMPRRGPGNDDCRSPISACRSATTWATCSSPMARSSASILRADPRRGSTDAVDTERIMRGAQEQLVWRQEHLRRELTDMLVATESSRALAGGFQGRGALGESVGIVVIVDFSVDDS